MEMPVWFAILALGAFGLVFGSFGNVVIWRVPRGESIVAPPSHCPRCGQPIRWYDNVPVLSWVLLRGRCRDCGEPISPRYPAIEAASGVLWALAGWRWGVSLTSVAGALFFYLLLLLAVIDADTGRLPNPIVAWAAGIGVAAAVVTQTTGLAAGPLVAGTGWLAAPLAGAAAGAAIGLGVSGALAAAYHAARGMAGLGMGDLKLLAAMGLFLGPWVLLAYVLGSLMGLIGGLAAILQARRAGEESSPMVHFGPYLASGAIITALVGPSLWAGYLDFTYRLIARVLG